jgi:hypothetical protein
MPITAWKPATQVSRGNVSVGLAPAVADINIPKITELTATGTYGLECAIQTFNGTSSSDSETVDWLCDPASEQLPGSTTHEMDDLVIKGTGQADAALITALKVGQKVYLWRRDGKATSTALAVGDFLWVWEVIITSIDPLEANNTFIGITAHITVIRRSTTAVAAVA